MMTHGFSFPDEKNANFPDYDSDDLECPNCGEEFLSLEELVEHLDACPDMEEV